MIPLLKVYVPEADTEKEWYTFEIKNSETNQKSTQRKR